MSKVKNRPTIAIISVTTACCLLLAVTGLSIVNWLSTSNKVATMQESQALDKSKIEDLQKQLTESDQAHKDLQSKYDSVLANYNNILKSQQQSVAQPTTQRSKPVTCSSFGSTTSVTCYNPY